MRMNTLDTRYDLYNNAYSNVLEKYKSNPTQDITPLIKSLIIYGVKMVNSKYGYAPTKEQAEYEFKFSDNIKTFMGTLNPNEFANIFPIDKDFDGKKYECKDYFYTRDYVAKLDQNQPIGEEIENFLWEYTNREVIKFNVRLIRCLSNLRQFRGEPLLMREWLSISGLKANSMYIDDKGTEFMIDGQTGKTNKLIKSKQRYLKVIKN